MILIFFVGNCFVFFVVVFCFLEDVDLLFVLMVGIFDGIG